MPLQRADFATLTVISVTFAGKLEQIPEKWTEVRIFGAWIDPSIFRTTQLAASLPPKEKRVHLATYEPDP